MKRTVYIITYIVRIWLMTTVVHIFAGMCILLCKVINVVVNTIL